jgi:hypothetical protein
VKSVLAIVTAAIAPMAAFQCGLEQNMKKRRGFFCIGTSSRHMPFIADNYAL